MLKFLIRAVDIMGMLYANKNNKKILKELWE